MRAQSTYLTMNWAWLHVHTYSASVGICCRVRGKLIVFAGRIKRAGWWEQSWRGQRAAGLGCQIHLLTMMNHHSNSRPINGFSQWLNTGHLNDFLGPWRHILQKNWQPDDLAAVGIVAPVAHSWISHIWNSVGNWVASRLTDTWGARRLRGSWNEEV